MNNNTIITAPGGVEELIGHLGDYKWPAFYFSTVEPLFSRHPRVQRKFSLNRGVP